MDAIAGIGWSRYCGLVPAVRLVFLIRGLMRGRFWSATETCAGSIPPVDYASHVGTVKDASVKDDETAAFLRERIRGLRPGWLTGIRTASATCVILMVPVHGQ